MSQHIVITGGTRGIGLGLADALLARGCRVSLCGRSTASTQAAVAQLSAAHDPARVFGQAADVGVFDQVQALWDAAVAQHGPVDVWINNAGLSHPQRPFWDLDADAIDTLLHANTYGIMFGAQVALKGMLAQGHGQVYLMEGLGSDGRITPGLTLYGATKYTVAYLTKALQKELRQHAGQSSRVQVIALSPGMVVTDLLVEGYTGEDMARAKRIFNILADRVETVTPYLAEQILANDAGKRIAWLTTPKILRRFLSAPFVKRDVFTGAALSAPAEQSTHTG